MEGAKTKVWVPSGVCPDGCTEWWSPRGLRVLGAPEEAETPLAALGELGAAVGEPGLAGGPNLVREAWVRRMFFFSNFPHLGGAMMPARVVSYRGAHVGPRPTCAAGATNLCNRGAQVTRSGCTG